MKELNIPLGIQLDKAMQQLYEAPKMEMLIMPNLEIEELTQT